MAAELVVVAAELLGGVHRGVGVAHQRLGVVAVLGVQRDAEAGGDVEPLAFDHAGLGDGGEELLRHRLGVLGLADLEQHGELVAAEAAHQVAVAHRAAQAAGEGLQHAVADAVAERVVDHLEAVEVEEEHGQAAAAQAGGGERGSPGGR